MFIRVFAITIGIVALPLAVANAAIVIEFENQNFDGAGVYSFDMTATAVGQTETISGFTMPLQLANGASFLPETPDSSLSDIEFTPNAFLETKGASSDFGTFGFSVTAVDADGSPLVLGDGQRSVLLSIPINVTVPGDALVENVTLANLFDITGATSVEFGPNFAAAATAIPEPSSVLFLAGITMVGSLGMRRRNRRR